MSDSVMLLDMTRISVEGVFYGLGGVSGNVMLLGMTRTVSETA